MCHLIQRVMFVTIIFFNGSKLLYIEVGEVACCCAIVVIYRRLEVLRNFCPKVQSCSSKMVKFNSQVAMISYCSYAVSAIGTTVI